MTWEFSPELHTWWRLSCPAGHGSCSVGEKATLLRVVEAAQRMVGCCLAAATPTTDIYTSRLSKTAEL